MNRRAQIALTPEEVRDFLAGHRKVQVATVGPHGAPHLATLFYTLLDGRIAFTTYRAAQKVVNLRRDPTMTCLVEDGTEYGELRGAVLYGRGTVVEDRETLLRVATVVGARIAGLAPPAPDAPADPAFAAAIERTVRKRVAVVMEPDRVVSWDHRKMGAAQAGLTDSGTERA